MAGKPDVDDVEIEAEVVTDGDDYLVKAIIKFNKDVKDKKEAKEWLADAIMSSKGSDNQQ